VFLGDPKQQVLTDPQSLNSYSYANGNPITKSDPNDKFALPLIFGLLELSPELLASGAAITSVTADSALNDYLTATNPVRPLIPR
jgi:hypothetical protein